MSSIKSPKVPKIPSAHKLNNLEIEQQTAQDLTETINEYTEGLEESPIGELLYGYKDKDGEIHKEFEMREITGKDTEAINEPAVKNNVGKIVTKLLSRCIVRIGPYTQENIGMGTWHEIIRNLTVGDQDYMLICLRKYSLDGEIKSHNKCPNSDCKATVETILDLSELTIKPFITEKVSFILPRGFKDKKGEVHKSGVMRMPTGLDRELFLPIAQNNLAKAETLMLTRLCKFDDGYAMDNDTMANLTVKDRRYLDELQQENLFGVDLTYDLFCDSCGTSFKATLNQVESFF